MKGTLSENKDKYKSKTAEQSVAHVIEECGEVLAAAGKAFRFGPGSVNPELPPKQQETNIAWFERELHDLHHAIKEYWRIKREHA